MLKLGQDRLFELNLLTSSQQNENSCFPYGVNKVDVECVSCDIPQTIQYSPLCKASFNYSLNGQSKQYIDELLVVSHETTAIFNTIYFAGAPAAPPTTRRVGGAEG